MNSNGDRHSQYELAPFKMPDTGRQDLPDVFFRRFFRTKAEQTLRNAVVMQSVLDARTPLGYWVLHAQDLICVSHACKAFYCALMQCNYLRQRQAVIFPSYMLIDRTVEQVLYNRFVNGVLVSSCKMCNKGKFTIHGDDREFMCIDYCMECIEERQWHRGMIAAEDLRSVVNSCTQYDTDSKYMHAKTLLDFLQAGDFNGYFVHQLVKGHFPEHHFDFTSAQELATRGTSAFLLVCRNLGDRMCDYMRLILGGSELVNDMKNLREPLYWVADVAANVLAVYRAIEEDIERTTNALSVAKTEYTKQEARQVSRMYQRSVFDSATYLADPNSIMERAKAICNYTQCPLSRGEEQMLRARIETLPRTCVHGLAQHRCGVFDYRAIWLPDLLECHRRKSVYLTKTLEIIKRTKEVELHTFEPLPVVHVQQSQYEYLWDLADIPLLIGGKEVTEKDFIVHGSMGEGVSRRLAFNVYGKKRPRLSSVPLPQPNAPPSPPPSPDNQQQ